MILITQPRVGHSHNEIIALQMSAESLGHEVLPSPYSWRMEDDLISKNLDGMPYGSQLFCEAIAQQMNWKLIANSFDWLARVPQEFTKRNVEFMTLGEARKITERKFIKPADDKCFDAKVYEAGEFNPKDFVEDNYPVLVSEIVDWTHEYRCFVSGTKCITWSNYIFEGEINNPKYHYVVPEGFECPISFVERLMNKFETVPSVVDIGIIPGKGWAVIETNPAWASGLYGCDPVAALQVMKDSVVQS